MSKKCQDCGFELTDKMNFCPKCHARYTGIRTPDVPDKSPVEWVDEYFGARIAELKIKKFGGWGLTVNALLATEAEYVFTLHQFNFDKALQKFGMNPEFFDFDRCIMIFDNMGSTWGKNTNGGIITLDGIWWSYSPGVENKVAGCEWGEVESIVQKYNMWRNDYIEVNGDYVVIDAMSDTYLGKYSFARFLSAISGKEVVRG